MRGRLVVLAAVLAIAGCAKPLEVSSITEIRPSDGGKGVDVFAVQRQRGDVVPEFAGDQIVDVRTYMDTDSDGRVEIAGADCQVKTPAKVRVPLYRAQSTTLEVSGSKAGFRPKMITVGAFDVTRQQRMGSGANGGLVGPVAVAAIDAFSDNSKYD